MVLTKPGCKLRAMIQVPVLKTGLYSFLSKREAFAKNEMSILVNKSTITEMVYNSLSVEDL